MRNEWNSAEEFRVAPTGSTEGMECGSLDRFQHSEPDLSVLMVAWVMSPWPPAHRFWGGFQVFDPVGLSSGLFRSPRSARHFRQCLQDIRSARPTEVWQLQEKLKIAATVVALECLCGPVELAPQDRHALQEGLLKLLKSPPDAFEPSWAMAARPAKLPEGLIFKCRDGWKAALKRDWEGIYGP